MTVPRRADGRIPICYLAPWVDYGGSDKGTIDWFRWLDRDRFAPILVTTQPSANRRLVEIYDYADEVWPLSEFLAGQHFPSCIFDIIHSRGVEVLHLMNSRLGYDLLPDLASLPKPPSVVVQLHVEEPDKSGYVRYVTTRYGNLVDAFSVSSEHLAHAVRGYHINPGKIHVIPTGVDAEHEFNPARVSPVTVVQQDGFNILFPGRLTEQKDPLLMVKVIKNVVKANPVLHVHVVGDGHLELDVKKLVHEQGLDGHFSFHAPSRNLATWYSACDLLLMTSTFEGVPYVVYEAMAMKLPIVAPALPGIVELMGNTGGLLVDPGEGATAYSHALEELIGDRARADALALAGRERVLRDFSLREMGRAHSELYESLICPNSSAPSSIAPRASRTQMAHPTQCDFSHTSDVAEPKAKLRFSTRPSRGQPLVSIIVPCFNHGCFLPECVESIVSQEYRALEIIIVDDASTEVGTLQVLRELESKYDICVMRQASNFGPSAARNLAISKAKGRYTLPVDADNILLPGAVANLVAQLQSAGENIGFIYPNCQYFGTRDDYFQPPRFNLALLLAGNYCDTCSLIDREIFDAGLSYAEDIKLGHEDWDFVLTLAAMGVRGEPAHGETLMYRKHGFTRSDAVEYASNAFHEEIQTRHPELYGGDSSTGQFGRWRGPAARIKAREAPSLSIVLTVRTDFDREAGERLLDRLEGQSCRDFELIVECDSTPRQTYAFPIRRIPPDLCMNMITLTNEGLQLARGNYILMAGDEMLELLSESSFVERLFRTFWANPKLQAVAFVDGPRGCFPYQLLDDVKICQPAYALAWQVDAQRVLPASIHVGETPIAECVARAMSAKGVELQWRHTATVGQYAGNVGEGWLAFADHRDHADSHRRQERAMASRLGPALPALKWDDIKRWAGAVSWNPPETQLLTRHREIDGQRRVVRWGRLSPPGFLLERDLGAIQCFAPPGTVRLVRGPDGFRTVQRGSSRPNGTDELGHLELAPLPLFQTVERAVLRDGTETLVNGEGDSLRDEAEVLEFLGFIEAFPNKPLAPSDARRPFHGVVGLLRCIDRDARRHTYHVGSTDPDDELVGELGGLHLTEEPGSVALWLDGHGRVAIDRCISDFHRCDSGRLFRWCVAPLAWRHFGHVRGRLRAIGRRCWDAARIAVGDLDRSSGLLEPASGQQRHSGQVTLAGYLYGEDGEGRRELFSAIHPVTGDHLLTRDPLETADMGYRAAVSVGYVLDQAPVTGTLEMRRVSVPWASRFGLEVRR